MKICFIDSLINNAIGKVDVDSVNCIAEDSTLTAYYTMPIVCAYMVNVNDTLLSSKYIELRDVWRRGMELLLSCPYTIINAGEV